MEHFHVQRHDNDEDILRTDDMGTAMDYAATELDISVDSEHTMIRAQGEAGDFEGAYQSWERVEAWANLVDNAANIHNQYASKAVDRAPLYRADDAETLAKLRQHADHVMTMINQEGPDGFRMWVCFDVECAPTDDDDD